MENKKEVQEPQKTPEVTAPKAEEAKEIPSREIKPEETKPGKVESEKAGLTPEELEDLKHKAEVSSQNFERAKKAEGRVEKLETQLADNEVLPEFDDAEVGKLKDDVSELKAELGKSKVLERYPDLKDLWNEFEEFRADPENKGMNLNTAAKAFRVEKGLLEPRREGLEKTTGGKPVSVSSGMSVEEVTKLRNTDYKKYREMIKKGQIKIS